MFHFKMFLVLVALFFASVRADAFIIAGAIRQNANMTWSVISDSAHTSMNIDSVTVKDNFIVVKYSQTASKVITFIVADDETFATKNYKAGASVGLGSALIAVSKNGSLVNLKKEVMPKGSNFWIYGVMQD